MTNSLIYVKFKLQICRYTTHLPYHKTSAHIVGMTESIIQFTVFTEAKENSIYHHLKPNKGTQLSHDSCYL